MSAPAAIAFSARPDPAMRGPVLVLGDDCGAFLGAVRSLGRAGLEVHGASPGNASPAHASLYLAAAHVLPAYRGDGAAWVAAMRGLLREHGFELIVPTSDASLVQLAAHEADLGAATCAIPSRAAIDLFTDKWATREAAQALGIAVPPALAIEPGCDADALADRLGLPLIVKSRSSYARGQTAQKSTVRLVTRREDLVPAIACGKELIAESFIPGFCRGVSILAYEGEVLQAFQHRRLRQEHATGPSSWRVSETLDPRLADAVRKLAARANYTGIAMFEFRCRAGSEDYALLEVNPRAWGSMQLAADAGADYLADLHALLIERRLPTRRFDFPAGRQKMSLHGESEALARGWNDGAGIAERARLIGRLVFFLVSLAGGRGFDSYAPDDPAPFRAERRAILQRLRGKAGKLAPGAARWAGA